MYPLYTNADNDPELFQNDLSSLLGPWPTVVLCCSAMSQLICFGRVVTVTLRSGWHLRLTSSQHRSLCHPACVAEKLHHAVHGDRENGNLRI